MPLFFVDCMASEESHSHHCSSLCSRGILFYLFFLIFITLKMACLNVCCFEVFFVLLLLFLEKFQLLLSQIFLLSSS